MTRGVVRPPLKQPGEGAGFANNFLLTLGDRLRATDDAEEVKTVALEMLSEWLGTDRVGYRELDESNEALRNLSGPWATLPLTDFGAELAGELRAGKTVVVNDSDVDGRVRGPRATKTWAALQMRSLIAVPLIRKRKLLAILFVLEPRARVWTKAEVQLVHDVAERTWEAVERARAEAALRQSEERLRGLADAMPALISSLDAGLHFRFVNRLYTDWFGLPREQILGRHARDVLGEEMYAVRRPYLERALAGESVTFEANFPSSSVRHTMVKLVPHLAEDGRVVGVYSLIQDVTDMKRVEAELRHSRDEFAAVLDAAPAGIVIANGATGTMVRANRAAAEILRLELGDTAFGAENRSLMSPAKVFDAQGRELGIGDLAVARAARGETSLMHEEHLVFEDGTERHLLGNATPLRDALGNVRGAVGAFVDISEHKRAHTALQEERSTLETLNQVGTAMAAELDPERLMDLITKAGVQITGAKYGAFVHGDTDAALNQSQGESVPIVQTSFGAERADFTRFVTGHSTLLRASLESGAIVRSDDLPGDSRFPESARMRSGDGLPMRSYLAVPVGSAGSIIGTLVFGHPQAGRFDHRHERLMAGVVGQAAISLDNAHLYRKAQIEIENRTRAERYQRLLIAELNHRVKNTLAIVQSVAQQTFHDGSDMEEARRAFEGRLAALASAHNVLTSRNWEHAHLAEIIEGIFAAFHPAAGGRGVLNGIDMRVGPKTAVSLAMAFHELATNAVKYGAWSNDTGLVRVEWQVCEGDPSPRLHLVWREEGGPPVAPAGRKGFGSRMVERALAAELGGTVNLVFDRAGLRCEIDAPIPDLPESAGAQLREADDGNA